MATSPVSSKSTNNFSQTTNNASASAKSYMNTFASKARDAIFEASKHSLYGSSKGFLAKAELKVLNKAGWIPVVSYVSGAVRKIAGNLMILASIVELVARVLFMAIAYATGNLKGKDLEKQQELLWDVPKLFIHGAANVVRGGLEMSCILGNILCLIYDLLELRIKYSEDAEKAAKASAANGITITV